MPDRPARGGVTQRISHRPGREPLELIDEITARLGLDVMPLTWPVGIASEFHGLLARTTGDYLKLTRTPGGATIAQEDRLTPPMPSPSNRRPRRSPSKNTNCSPKLG